MENNLSENQNNQTVAIWGPDGLIFIAPSLKQMVTENGKFNVRLDQSRQTIEKRA